MDLYHDLPCYLVSIHMTRPHHCPSPSPCWLPLVIVVAATHHYSHRHRSCYTATPAVSGAWQHLHMHSIQTESRPNIKLSYYNTVSAAGLLWYIMASLFYCSSLESCVIGGKATGSPAASNVGEQVTVRQKNFYDE